VVSGNDFNLRWRFTPLDRLVDQSSDWQRLASRYASAPFLQLDFIRPLLRQFASGREQLAIGEHAGRVVALAILAPAHRGRQESFQPSQLPLGPVLLDDSISPAVALESLGRQVPLSTVVVGFTQLDEAIYPRPAESGGLVVGTYIQTAWIDVNGTFDEYWESRGKNLRQNVRKQRRKLQEDGLESRLDILRAPEAVARGIEEYGQLESAGWKASGGTAIHPDNAQGRFYREMLERFCARDRGCIFRYLFSDRVVAVDLCIEDDTTLVILKTTYDESMKAHSPAVLLHEEAFADVWRNGRIRRIEFFGKVMDWHKRWTDDARDIYHLTRYRWKWIRQLRSSRTAPSPSEPPAST
jgi:CelD/BcsL family acetyltransferase involved in cellulose biosynthesis